MGLIAGQGLTDLGSLMSRWIIRHQSNRHQGALLTSRNQEVTITLTIRKIVKEEQSRRLVEMEKEDGIYTNKIDGQPTSMPLNIYNQKMVRMEEQEVRVVTSISSHDSLCSFWP